MNEFSASASVHEGEEHHGVVVETVERSMFVRYAGASGDFNPIHWDREFARGSGYEDVFGMGMFAAGALAGFLASWLGRDSVRSFRCRFVAQTWAGERLTGRGRIVRVFDEPDAGGRIGRWAECELTLVNGSDETKVAGTATCAVRASPSP